MGFIGKLFGQHNDGAPGVQVLEHPSEEVCLHTAAAPEWDNIDDMGKQDRIARFRCPACGDVFSADEYRRIQSAGLARMSHVMERGPGEDQS